METFTSAISEVGGGLRKNRDMDGDKDGNGDGDGDGDGDGYMGIFGIIHLCK